MKIHPGACALWAATLALPAAAQHQHQHQHQHDHPSPPAARAAPAVAAKPPPAVASTAVQPAPAKSALAGYRAFDPAEPLKDWRAANDEVRAAGGHIGLMKQTPGTAPPVHGDHGGKR